VSYELCLWKWKRGKSSSRGATYLLVAEDSDCPWIARLPVVRIRSKMDARFPGWEDADAERCRFECDVTPRAIHLHLNGSTPAEVQEWFLGLAQDEGLVVFDPQAEEVSAEDRRIANELAGSEDKELVPVQLADLLKRAESGDSDAQLRTGNAYDFGEGVAVDKEKAFQWYSLAASSGLQEAIFNLAACYRRGEGTAKDIRKAIELYERAAETDHLLAPYELGQIFASGEGVPVDKARAASLFRIAREHGHPSARRALRLLGEEP